MLRLFVGIEFPPELKLRLSLLCTSIPGARWIDPEHGWIVLGAEVAPGDQILFCRRDPESARADMSRMLRQLKGRIPGLPKAGVYVSCIGRGTALFGEPGVETEMIRDTLGDFPLIGFFANGEISRDRLYGHTGVLTLFT